LRGRIKGRETPNARKEGEFCKTPLPPALLHPQQTPKKQIEKTTIKRRRVQERGT